MLPIPYRTTAAQPTMQCLKEETTGRYNFVQCVCQSGRLLILCCTNNISMFLGAYVFVLHVPTGFIGISLQCTFSCL